MILCQNQQKVAYHGLHLSSLGAVALGHAVDHYRIGSERRNIEAKPCQKVRMLAEKIHVLDSDMDSNREKGGLCHMLVARQGIEEAVI